jgi:hypothetical protein
MAALITIEQARRQIRLLPEDTSFDAELDQICEDATAIVIDYLKRPDHTWTASYDPAGGSPYDQEFVIVRAAIAEVVTNLWRHRGDENAPGPLTDRVTSMLHRLRDPAIA